MFLTIGILTFVNAFMTWTLSFLKLIQLSIISLQFLGEHAQVKLPIRLITSGSAAPLVECTAPTPSSSPYTLLPSATAVDIQVLLCPLLPLLMTQTSSVLSQFAPGHPQRSRAAGTRMEVVSCTSTQEVLALSQ